MCVYFNLLWVCVCALRVPMHVPVCCPWFVYEVKHT